ncbi:MAG: SDR family NAD(P)-dependent oxidoreductase [Clostridiales bacterium]|nr:SDR family NAD(P)-dependent oxidoreductase [Clostridiales bacterium]
MKYTMEDLAFLKNNRAKQHNTDARMDGKLCVLSGATSGVGLAGARRLAQGGANLVLVARNREKAEAVKAELEAAYPITADIVIADFSRLSDVRGAAKEIGGKYPGIDVLINSAGLYSTRRKLTPDGNELCFQVNHLSSLLLTMLLLKNIAKSPQGRVIQVNSEGHRFGGLNLNDLDWSLRFYFGLRAYGASKTAQIMAVRTLALLLTETGVTVNAMHPGALRTNIGRNNGLLYRAWLRGVMWHFLKDPTISGEALYYLAAAPELKATSGKYFNLTIEEKPMPHALDEAVQARVWAKSLELIGLPQAF